MTVISYIAKREIEKSSFAASGTDISVASIDNSFNSISTPLNGVADDEWVLSSGLINQVNNGWHQANGASTATKIITDTAALVDEAAGANISLQGYVRGLGQSYDIEFSARQLERSVRVDRKVQTALGGQRETLLNRRDVFWDIGTRIIDESELAQWREFLASVEGGETFTLDPYGTIASPDNPVACVLDRPDYSERRVSSVKRYTIAFRVKLL